MILIQGVEGGSDAMDDHDDDVRWSSGECFKVASSMDVFDMSLLPLEAKRRSISSPHIAAEH